MRFALEACLPFFRLWTKEDLQEATKDHTRATQAKWPLLAVIFLMWRWALINRKTTFERVRIEAWPVLRKVMEFENIQLPELPVTAQAFTQARQKVGMKPLQHLHQTANDKMRREFDDMLCYKTLRLWAVDGSSLNLPSRKELDEAFGRPSSTPGAHVAYPQAFFVTLELIQLGWIYDYRLDRHDASELSMTFELTQKLGKGDLLLGDRLFFDSKWFLQLDQRDVKFLFRVASNRVKCLTRESQEKVDVLHQKSTIVDCEVDLKVDTDHHGNARHILRCRYVEIQRPNQETLYFMTNLSEEFADAEEIAALYWRRWGIEIEFRIFKGDNHLPIVLSRKEHTIRQEILLRVLAHNSVRYVQAEACRKEYADFSITTAAEEFESINTPVAKEEIQQERIAAINNDDNDSKAEQTQLENDKWKPRHLAENRNILPTDLRIGPAVALILGNILSLLLCPTLHPSHLYDQLLTEVLSYKILVKPGRSYPRRGRKYRKKKSKGNLKAQYQRRKQRHAKIGAAPAT